MLKMVDKFSEKNLTMISKDEITRKIAYCNSLKAYLKKVLIILGCQLRL
jgi:hypothetical protein